VSIEKIVNWLVPFPVELLKSGRIPPILIKLSVVELCDLCPEVCETLKYQYKHYQNEQSGWKHLSQNQLCKGNIVAQHNVWHNVLSMNNVRN